MQNLHNFKIQLKMKMADDLESVFLNLKERLSFTSRVFNDFILLYGSYNDVKDAFSKDTVSRYDRNLEIAKVRHNLIHLIDKITEDDINDLPFLIKVEDVEILEEEPGIFDLLENSQNSFADFTECVLRLSGYTDGWNSEIAERTFEIERINASVSGQGKIIAIRKVFEKVAESTDNYNLNVERELPTLKLLVNRNIKDYLTAIEFIYSQDLTEENIQSLRELHDSINFLINSVKDSKIGLLKMTSAVEQLPNFEKNFNKAKRRNLELMKDIQDLLKEFQSNLEGFEDNIDFTLRSA